MMTFYDRTRCLNIIKTITTEVGGLMGAVPIYEELRANEIEQMITTLDERLLELNNSVDLLRKSIEDAE